MKSTLFIAAILASSLALSNAAEKSPITGKFGAAWDNYYSFNNIVPVGAVSQDAVTIGIQAQYEFPGACNVVTAFSNSSLSSGALEDQTSFFLGVNGKPSWANNNLDLTFGYQLYDGGLPGLFDAWGHADKLHDGTPSGMNHLVALKAAYNIPTSNWQITGSAAYNMVDNDGWLLNCGINYTVKTCDKLSFVFGGDVSFSQGYIRIGDNLNGTDGYRLYICAPYKASDIITVTPYISAVWSGHNVIAMNKVTGNAFKNFAPMAGACVSFSF